MYFDELTWSRVIKVTRFHTIQKERTHNNHTRRIKNEKSTNKLRIQKKYKVNEKWRNTRGFNFNNHPHESYVMAGALLAHASSHFLFWIFFVANISICYCNWSCIVESTFLRKQNFAEFTTLSLITAKWVIFEFAELNNWRHMVCCLHQLGENPYSYNFKWDFVFLSGFKWYIIKQVIDGMKLADSCEMKYHTRLDMSGVISQRAHTHCYYFNCTDYFPQLSCCSFG